jgi:16S rRNA C1402 (ribose-2'-O) methylase RsmI
MIFYEAPHRIQRTLEDMQQILGDRCICVVRELTKVHEEWVSGLISEVRSRIRALGEFVIVVEPSAGTPPAKALRSREEVLEALGMSRNELYDLFFRK